jgi:hypothetical protein
MTKTQQAYKDALPAIQAFAEGRPIQVRQPGLINDWDDFIGHSPCFTDLAFQWRAKPEAKLREWTLEEVPVGAVIRLKKDHSVKRLIVAVDITWRYQIAIGTRPDELPGTTCLELFTGWEHTLDRDSRNATWLPCGVKE